jgi:ribonuclease HI
VKRHRSPLHHLTHLYNTVPDNIETITVTRRNPKLGNPFSTQIADTRDASIAMLNEDTADIKIFTDGSGLDGKAGAAAALYRSNRPPKVLRYHLGPLTQHTTTDSEAVGAVLGMTLLYAERNVTTVSVNLDNQSVISATGIRRPRPGQHIIVELTNLADEAAARFGNQLKLALRWISGHSGIDGNELVDIEAKKAAQGDSSEVHRLPTLLTDYVLGHSIAALKQEHIKKLKAAWHDRWKASPRYSRATKTDSSFPFTKFRKAADGLTRAQTSILVQLRTGHIGLNKHLARINKSESALCPTCSLSEESVHHLLFECPSHRNARHHLTKALGRKASSLKFLLNNKKGISEVLKFIGRTGRLRRNFGDVTPRMSAL